eukprot:409235-Amphidinium_carterae.1
MVQVGSVSSDSGEDKLRWTCPRSVADAKLELHDRPEAGRRLRRAHGFCTGNRMDPWYADGGLTQLRMVLNVVVKCCVRWSVAGPQR